MNLFIFVRIKCVTVARFMPTHVFCHAVSCILRTMIVATRDIGRILRTFYVLISLQRAILAI